MHSWEYISNGLLEHWYLKFLFKWRNYPILGRYASFFMYNHIFDAFEITIAFIEVFF
jgi:hypothetical protein